MESPAKAEWKPARERQFLPPIWPLLAIVVVIVGIAVWLSHKQQAASPGEVSPCDQRVDLPGRRSRLRR
jgi:tryptophan-rich sensory protein